MMGKEIVWTGMNFNLCEDLAIKYKSKSQKIRVMSESWVSHNIFCPSCGNVHIYKLHNNMPVADLKCEGCGEMYELKSKNGTIGNKITDGAYSTMIERITSKNNPNLFAMQYSNNLQVINLTFIPKFFFAPSVIEKRKPLSESARRAGWMGCNILYSEIPEQGKITIIKNQVISDKKSVVDNYIKVKNLQTSNMENRSWLLDILLCINNIPTINFSLQDMYKFTNNLQLKHVNNHNVEAKIRQQLQFLRDKGFIEFLGKGQYRKLL